MTLLTNTKKPLKKSSIWDSLELYEAVRQDNRLHDSNGRCSMCGKKTDVSLNVIKDKIDGDFAHWVCKRCLTLLGKNDND